jgi:hypothetical protein
MANYSHARVQFDQALGTTLDVNHVVLADALAGSVGNPAGGAKNEVKK